MTVDGYQVIADRETGRKHEADTHQCPHCGGHFVMQRGSGKQRAWCHRCCAVTCGRPGCARCKHFMAAIEEIERRASFEARYGTWPR